MAPGPSNTHRRPTVTRQTSNGYNSPSSSTPSNAAQKLSNTQRDEDDGLVMREKVERDGNSVGKAGGVDVGVTRPKRRLSRALSSGTASPPTTPNGTGHHGLTHAQSTYQALHNQLAGATQSSHSFNRHSPPTLDLKNVYLASAATPKKDGGPRLWGIELKWISLVTLALQNAFLTIIMHYSRISTAPNKTYSAAAAVLLNELLKGSISIIIALRKIDVDMQNTTSHSEKDPKHLNRSVVSRFPSYLHSSRLQNLSTQVFSPDCYKLAVPAILYVIQNNLQYVAASNLDVATFQVTYQMKILTTAFFSVLMLRKRLSKAKWAALVMLAVGVGIVQIQSTAAPAHGAAAGVKLNKGSAALRSDIPDPLDEPYTRVMHPFRGFVAVTLACMTSGLAGVYFEFILKSSSGSSPPPDLWVRNTQLSLFSLVPALVPILFGSNGEGVGYIEGVIGKFRHFNGWAMGTVLTQTFGGLITAIVIRYSDNIMKGFATSLSIIISFLASVALFSYPITLAFVCGSSIVLAATYLYNSPGTTSAPSTRTAVAVQPGSPIPTSAPILGEPERPSRASSVINLLGLGSSTPSSRRPSASDLRSQAQMGFTSYSPSPALSQGSINHNHIYAASAPGTPNLGSANQSSTNVTNASDQYNNSNNNKGSDQNGYSPQPSGKTNG